MNRGHRGLNQIIPGLNEHYAYTLYNSPDFAKFVSGIEKRAKNTSLESRNDLRQAEQARDLAKARNSVAHLRTSITKEKLQGALDAAETTLAKQRKLVRKADKLKPEDRLSLRVYRKSGVPAVVSGNIILFDRKHLPRFRPR